MPAEMWDNFSEDEQGMGISVDICNKTLRGTACGEKWKMAVVCQIYTNKGKAREHNDYTRMSLLQVVGEFFCSILASRLSLMNDNDKVLSRLQGRFAPKEATVHNIFCNQKQP